MEELTIDREDIDVLHEKDNYRRQEIWTNGEWVRFGRDVTGNRYIEIKAEELREFTETLRAQNSVEIHSLETSIGAGRKYIVNAGRSLDVYYNQKHVLYHGDHEYGILYSALKRVREKQETFDYEQLARSYAKSLIQSFWEIEGVTEKAKNEVVVRAVDPDGSRVALNFIDTLRDDEMIWVDQNSVFVRDEGISYKFRVKAAELPGAPDE